MSSRRRSPSPEPRHRDQFGRDESRRGKYSSPNPESHSSSGGSSSSNNRFYQHDRRRRTPSPESPRPPRHHSRVPRGNWRGGAHSQNRPEPGPPRGAFNFSEEDWVQTGRVGGSRGPASAARSAPAHSADSEAEALFHKLRTYTPYLRKRRDQIKAEGKERQFEEQLDEIRFWLESARDVRSMETLGAQALKNILVLVMEMARAHPIRTPEKPPRVEAPVIDVSSDEEVEEDTRAGTSGAGARARSRSPTPEPKPEPRPAPRVRPRQRLSAAFPKEGTNWDYDPSKPEEEEDDFADWEDPEPVPQEPPWERRKRERLEEERLAKSRNPERPRPNPVTPNQRGNAAGGSSRPVYNPFDTVSDDEPEDDARDFDEAPEPGPSFSPPVEEDAFEKSYQRPVRRPIVPEPHVQPPGPQIQAEQPPWVRPEATQSHAPPAPVVNVNGHETRGFPQNSVVPPHQTMTQQPIQVQQPPIDPRLVNSHGNVHTQPQAPPLIDPRLGPQRAPTYARVDPNHPHPPTMPLIPPVSVPAAMGMPGMPPVSHLGQLMANFVDTTSLTAGMDLTPDQKNRLAQNVVMTALNTAVTPSGAPMPVPGVFGAPNPAAGFPPQQFPTAPTRFPASGVNPHQEKLDRELLQAQARAKAELCFGNRSRYPPRSWQHRGTAPRPPPPRPVVPPRFQGPSRHGGPSHHPFRHDFSRSAREEAERREREAEATERERRREEERRKKIGDAPPAPLIASNQIAATIRPGRKLPKPPGTSAAEGATPKSKKELEEKRQRVQDKLSEMPIPKTKSRIEQLREDAVKTRRIKPQSVARRASKMDEGEQNSRSPTPEPPPPPPPSTETKSKKKKKTDRTSGGAKGTKRRRISSSSEEEDKPVAPSAPTEEGAASRGSEDMDISEGGSPEPPPPGTTPPPPAAEVVPPPEPKKASSTSPSKRSKNRELDSLHGYLKEMNFDERAVTGPRRRVAHTPRGAAAEEETASTNSNVSANVEDVINLVASAGGATKAARGRGASAARGRGRGRGSGRGRGRPRRDPPVASKKPGPPPRGRSTATARAAGTALRPELINALAAATAASAIPSRTDGEPEIEDIGVSSFEGGSESPVRGGIVIGRNDIIVNSGLGKIKLEKDWVPSVKVKTEPADEGDSDSTVGKGTEAEEEEDELEELEERKEEEDESIDIEYPVYNFGGGAEDEDDDDGRGAVTLDPKIKLEPEDVELQQQ